jgi:hypothetical protein
MVQESTSGGVNDQIVKKTSTKVKSLGSRKNNLQVAGKYFLLICFFDPVTKQFEILKRNLLTVAKNDAYKNLRPGGDDES